MTSVHGVNNMLLYVYIVNTFSKSDYDEHYINQRRKK